MSAGTVSLLESPYIPPKITGASSTP